MKDAQKPDHISLGTLIGNLKQGRFVIPDFQRDFEWSPQDIRDLMRSIFLDYYIGSLLLWKGKPENFSALACEPVYRYPGNGASPEHIVLDGQQRLTAMYYAFVAPDQPAPNRANRFLYFINVQRFMAGAHDDAFHYDWTKGGINLSKNAKAQFDAHMFPLSVVGSGGWDLPNWVQGYEAHWRAKAEAARAAEDSSAADEADRFAEDANQFGILLKDLTEQYQVAYVELDKDLALDKVCDIFTQVNSKGIRLDVFDLINALIKPKGLQLKHMWREAAPQLDFVNTGSMNVYVLQVMSILTQAYCSPKYLYYLLPGQEKTVRDANGVFSKHLPCDYLPGLIEKNGETTVRATLESHLISPAAFDILRRKPFTPEDFEAFITERHRTIQDAIEALLIKERLDLPPQLRDLDEQIEVVELVLRRVIADALDDDVSQIPSHLRDKITPRVEAARRKAAAATDHYDTLTGQLEFFDLRELQDTITNKSLWPLFEPRFKTKEALAGHFDHLGNLRNGIRHSRTVDEIARKYGEAALLWFERVLT